MNPSEKARLNRDLEKVPDWVSPGAAYSRGYSKGYNAGSRAHDSQFRELDKALLAVQARAERAEKGLGLGRCDECYHWRRQAGAKWGYCTLTESSVGTDWPWRGEPDQRIATKENFGCIRFAESPTPAGQVGRTGE